MRSFFRKAPTWTDYALFAGLAALLWGDALLGRRALFYDTLFRMFYPNAVFLRRSLNALEFPFWNPHIYSGVPFLANPQSALFYPATMLYALLDFDRALALDVWLHTALAAAFMARLAAEEGLSRPASLFAGVLYAFNGYFIRHYAYPSNFHAYVWAPLVLLWSGRCAAQWATARPQAMRAGLIAGALLALQVFSGHPQFVFYTIVAAWLCALMRVERRAFAPLLFIKGVALVLTAVQWVPALAFILDSPRGQALGYEWATSYSLAPGELLRMLLTPQWNRFFAPQSGDPHIVGLYFGLPVLALAAAGVKNRRCRPFVAIAALGLLLALGRHLPGYRALYVFCPPLRVFRFPAQALFFFSLGLPLLAAAGLQRMPPGRVVVPAVLVLCAVDLWAFGRRSVITIDPAFYRSTPPAVVFLQAHAGSTRAYLTPRSRAETRRSGKSGLEAWLKFKDSVLPNLAMAFGLRDAAGDEDMHYARYDRMLEELAQSPLSSRMDLLGIRYVLTLWDLPGGKFRRVFRGSVNVYENTGALPRAYWVPETTGLDDTRRPGKFVPARFVEDRANRVALEVEAPKPGYLILADSFDPGWKAWVNGRRAPVLRAYLIQRAVRVEAGRSQVEFRYVPRFFYSAAVLSLAGWVGLLFVIRQSPRALRGG